MPHRIPRVEQLLRRELAQIAASGDLRDPRLGGASWAVTDVRISADLSHARVFVDVLGGTTSRDAQEVLAGLRSSGSVVRSVLAGRLQMRRTPQLRFELDDTMERAGRIDEILAELAHERDDMTQQEEPGTAEIGGDTSGDASSSTDVSDTSGTRDDITRD